jgi:hypothetical protein
MIVLLIVAAIVYIAVVSQFAFTPEYDRAP